MPEQRGGSLGASETIKVGFLLLRDRIEEADGARSERGCDPAKEHGLDPKGKEEPLFASIFPW